MAVISIRAGLKAYFATYRIAGVSLVSSQIAGCSPANYFNQPESSPDYQEAYTETILHLHFGIELAIKELLHQKHLLLTSSTLPDSAVLLCRILHNEPIPHGEAEKMKSVEFAEALKRTIALIKEKQLDDNLSIIMDHKDLLENLNRLRNRIIHRGLFIMDYWAFDLDVSAYVIPFLTRLMSLPQFVNQGGQTGIVATEPPWKYKKLACGIDPLDEICKIGDATVSARKKLALLKELGRAAYENPLGDFAQSGSVLDMSIFDAEAKTRAQQNAEQEMRNTNHHTYYGANGLLKCPVCDQTTLVRYHDADGADNEVKCTCCSFNVAKLLGNGKEHGLEMEDFWPSETVSGHG